MRCDFTDICDYGIEFPDCEECRVCLEEKKKYDSITKQGRSQMKKQLKDVTLGDIDKLTSLGCDDCKVKTELGLCAICLSICDQDLDQEIDL